MKIFLFVYPFCSGPSLQSFSNEEKMLLSQAIHERYRVRGFQIYWLKAKNIPMEQMLPLFYDRDKMIEGTMEFNWNSNRFNNYEYQKKLMTEKKLYVDYTSFEEISKELEKDIYCSKNGYVEGQKIELFISGIDGIGTVKKLVQYFNQDERFDVTLDAGLTERFKEDCHRYGFKVQMGEYNLSDLVVMDSAEVLYTQGISTYENWHSSYIDDPLYKFSSFTPTMDIANAYLGEVLRDYKNFHKKKEKIQKDLAYINQMSVKEGKKPVVDVETNLLVMNNMIQAFIDLEKEKSDLDEEKILKM